MVPKIPWIHDVPIKVTTFIWRGKLGRIPTNVELVRRGVQIPNTLCPQCSQQDEDVYGNGLWCDIPVPRFVTIEALISFAKKWGRCSKKRNNLISVCYGTIWLLWKSRRDQVFKNIHSTPTSVVDKVKSLVYSWLIHRRIQCHHKWVEWCICPLRCL
uniref:Reverse transcriptase zinc-binding domain-containing protein n=1 Tax=Lactuca sativa TaxID=4236 RepID=A0A9R1VBQ2_LACSA|nr:hypothetical protein LSAT_V11C600306880 [Lactuca sativa]